MCAPNISYPGSIVQMLKCSSLVIPNLSKMITVALLKAQGQISNNGVSETIACVQLNNKPVFSFIGHTLLECFVKTDK